MLMMETKVTRRELLDQVALFVAVLGSRRVTYCSAPITSGKRFQQWLSRLGKRHDDLDGFASSLRSRHANEVMGPNMNQAQAVIRRLRARGEIVIDPTAVGPRRRWQQRDWRFFWKEVIQRYARRVVFVDGWEYSSGCVYEYLTAVR